MKRPFTRAGAALATACAMLALPTAARAESAADAWLYFGSTYTVYGGATADQGTHNTLLQVGPYGSDSGNGTTLFGTTSLSAGPVAFASVSSSGNLSGQYVGGGMTTTLYYLFEVVGPSAVTVPLLIDGRLAMAFGGADASAGASTQVSARVTDNYPYNSHVVSSDATPTVFCHDGQTDSCNTAFQLHVNAVAGTSTQIGQIGTVVLTAEASFGAWYFNSAYATAFADPLISIDPVFLAANPGYGLLFNAAVVNQLAPVPEPASWALMLAGVAAVGWMRRRRD